MENNKYSFDVDGINYYVNNYINQLGDLNGKNILDCPAGDGRTSYQLLQRGASVTSADLFPSFFKLLDQTCDEVNLQKGLPYKDDFFDIVICQEGIEHMQDQLYVLQEFSRVLKKGGTLILTAPSIDHLRAKFSMFVSNSDFYKRSPANELDSVWFSETDKNELYFGHVFFISAQKLRTLSKFSGFEIKKFVNTQIGFTSVLLFPLFYPFILLFNIFPFFSYKKYLKHVKGEIVNKVLIEQLKINCSPKLLLSKHLFVVFTKTNNKKEAIIKLKELTRGKTDKF